MTTMGDDADYIPVRETSHGGTRKTGFSPEDRAAVAQKSLKQQHLVAKLSREDLEDQYLRMYEENILLKKHARKQEDKIKRMATKLLRLVSDKKKAEQNIGVKKGRDIETEEMLEDLHGKIRDLERQNTQLKEKLMVTKQQLSMQGKRHAPYQHVQSRINTGVAKPPSSDPRVAKGMRVSGPPTNSAHSPTLPRYGHSLLEEARAENKQLEDVVDQLNEQINIYEQDIELLKEQMKMREAEFEEELLEIKRKTSADQKGQTAENIEMIKFKRELKAKSTELAKLRAEFMNLQDNLRTVKTSHDQVLQELEHVNSQLKGEQNRVLSLQNELKNGTTAQRTIVELQERITDLERECEILKEANEKLVSSALDLEKAREWQKRENALKVQIAQLEATLKADVGEKGNILDKLTGERDSHEQLQEEHRELRVKYYQIKNEYDELKEKMKFFTKESAVDFQEIEEALMIVKQKKERETQELDFLQKVEDEKDKDYERLVKELRVEHADTINELEKTREMLFVQYKFNKDYQSEVEAVTKKREEDKAEYETKLEEYAQLLDLRAARIRKLEGQLKDVAYGTRAYKIKPEDNDTSDVEEIDETVHLERGQNLFEIHIKRVNLSQEALRHLGDDEPTVFCTWDFYEYETQSTPVMRGPRANFEFTSQYLVKVDDFFLHYLQKDTTTLELHHTYGLDHRTVGACQLKMREILDRSQGRLHGTVPITGVSEGDLGMSYGSVEYWVRLRVPMEQALRLYKERSKALGYIDSNIKVTDQALEAMDESARRRPSDNVNELIIKLIKCNGLKARREGVQPAPYAMYKFFDFTDHDTTIVVGSNTPQFNDSKTYPVPMTGDLDRYLKTFPLQIYLFDDSDPDEESYLGVAKVPLLPLAHDKGIKGTFELHTPEGKVNGTIDISLQWSYTYIPPKGSTKTPAQLRAMVPDDKPEKLATLPGEEEEIKKQSGKNEMMAGAPGTRSPTSKPPRPKGPSAASTPYQKRQPPTIRVEDESQINQSQTQPPQPETMEIPDESTVLAGQDMDTVSEGTPVTGESDALTESEQVTPSASKEFAEVPKVEAAPASPQNIMQNSHEIKQEGSKTPIPEDIDEEDEDEISEDIEDESEAVPQSVSKDDPRHSEADTEETDTDIVMPERPPSSLNQNTNKNPDIVSVTISSVSLEEDSALMKDENIKIIYVEYAFLGLPLEETETPYSLPKPKPYQKITFNFRKVFHVDFDQNYERRQHLAGMLLPGDPQDGKIKFTLVSEPTDSDEDEDCMDIGVAFVSCKEILEKNKDLVNADVAIFNMDQTERVGTLTVSVECVAALQAVQQEILKETI